MTSTHHAFTSRVAYAAAHVVPAAWADNTSGTPAVLDWDSTLGFRSHLWSLGLGVAEAMDTAQRGMGLDWSATRELITRSAALAREEGGLVAAGVGTDQLTDGPHTLAEIERAYIEQLEHVLTAGARPILMASRHLAQAAVGPEDYLKTYTALIKQSSEPVILHWLGPMFDPALQGYWGTDSFESASETVLALIEECASGIDGIKVSLLDAEKERHLRGRLPAGVRLYTGDDYDYVDLIAGDGVHHSDALLGAFAAIAPLAATGLQALDRGDITGFRAVLEPTLPLSRHVFAAPTQYYKVGISFLAWLSGHQPGFTMVGGLQSARSLAHLRTAKMLADELELFPDPDLADRRFLALCTVHGVTP